MVGMIYLEQQGRLVRGGMGFGLEGLRVCMLDSYYTDGGFEFGKVRHGFDLGGTHWGGWVPKSRTVRLLVGEAQPLH